MTPDELADWGLRLVRRQARRHACSLAGIQADELIGEGVEALAQAINANDGKRNIKAYITIRVKGAMIDYKRRVGQRGRDGGPRISYSQARRNWWAAQSPETKVARSAMMNKIRWQRRAA